MNPAAYTGIKQKVPFQGKALSFTYALSILRQMLGGIAAHLCFSSACPAVSFANSFGSLPSLFLSAATASSEFEASSGFQWLVPFFCFSSWSLMWWSFFSGWPGFSTKLLSVMYGGNVARQRHFPVVMTHCWCGVTYRGRSPWVAEMSQQRRL